MRCLVVLIALAWSAPVLAKPTIAIAPIAGDSDKEVTAVVVEIAGDSAKVIKPKAVVKAIGKLGISGELDGKDAGKLQKSLKADAVIAGKVKKEGKNRKLRLTVFVKGKPSAFAVEFKTADSDKLRDGVREGLAKRLDDVKSDEDEAEERRKKQEQEAEERRVAEEREEKRKKKQRDDDEETEKKQKKRKKDRDVAAAEDPDEEVKVRKKKRRRDDDDEAEAVPRSLLRVDAGTSFGVRRLTYSAAQPPPRLGTFGYGARIEAEAYPFAGKGGGAAGLGLAGEYDKTLGLSITVPGGTAPIDQQHFSVGGRYRIGAAKTFTLGVDYKKRKYIADRSQLTQPGDLDVPDTNYTAVVPSAAVRLPAGAKAAFFGTLGGLLILDTGPIQSRDAFGAATVIGAELATGFDIALGKTWQLRVAGEYSQINFKFNGNGTQTMLRGITAATDRTFGVAATLAMSMY